MLCLLGVLYLVNGLFVLDLDVSKNMFLNVSCVACINVSKSLKWHARIRHIGEDRMVRLT